MLLPRLDTSGRPSFICTAGVLLIAAVLLLSSGPALGCGPGRLYAKRRIPRKLNAFVFKQHVPNVPENTLGASGLPEVKITRDHPKFKQLVPNYNADIVFKDEEGTGADRLMTQRLTEKVNTLAISVMNMWPGIRLRVTEAYDEEGYHAKNSLHEEGRAVDMTTSDRDRSKLGMLARLAVEAGFDFVYYESRSHVHCSVKSESADASKIGGCFSGSSTVQTLQGQVKMSGLKVGDSVLVVKPDGSLGYSEVILFLDRDENQIRLFQRIVTESGAKITITPSHLIFRSDENRTLDISEGHATFAKYIEIGDYLYVKRDTAAGSRISLERVIAVESGSEKGSFAPLTKEGNVVVNDVLASCYALLDDQSLAHFAFFPVRFMSDIEHLALNLLEKLPFSQMKEIISSHFEFLPAKFTSNMKHAMFHMLEKFHFVKLMPKNVTSQKGMHWYPELLYKMSYYLLLN
uniref:Hedgehog protein n=1 Tax=Cupiennius salei TaxID=6928 RepID=A0A0U5KSU2_CUPSA|nr:hedgehog A transcription factor [Cupiennius salei]